MQRRPRLAFQSDYWNVVKPTDVNADGRVAPNDALAIINQLNSLGSRQLAQARSGEAGSRLFVDVNNDGNISPIDALLVINQLNGEGQATPRVQFLVQTLAAGTNTPIDTIQAGAGLRRSDPGVGLAGRRQSEPWCIHRLLRPAL